MCEAPFTILWQIELKTFLESHVSAWITLLVLGDYPSDVDAFNTDFLAFWHSIRPVPQNPPQHRCPFAGAQQQSPTTHSPRDRLINHLNNVIQVHPDPSTMSIEGQGPLISALLIKSLTPPEDPCHLKHAEILPNLLSFLTAGFETTYTLTLVTLLQLSRPEHNELRGILRDECTSLQVRVSSNPC